MLWRRWHRWQAHSKLTPAAKVLKEQIEELQRTDAHAVGAERTLLRNHNQWCEENDVHDEDDWRRPALHRSSGGQHAYPSFSNLFNTCYISAPLQCLLHCPAVRDVPLAAEGEGDPFLLDWRGEMLDQFPRTAFG